MIKNVLSSIGGVEVYGVISVCLFFTVFSISVVVALRMNKAVARKLGALPLNDATPTTKESSHE